MAAVFLMCGMTLVLAGAWPAVSSAAPAPITDFANYPPPLPASCTVDGADVVPGVQFSVNGQTAASLRDLNITPGSTITMTWTSFATGCESIGIGLSYKIAKMPTFNPNDDQYLHSFVYCGPEGPACSPPFTLTLTLPPASVVPCGQLDAHIGPPLAIVGPSGRYYNLGNPRNMLISAFNGGTTPCDVPPCASNPTVPAASMLCTSQPPAATTTTSAPTATSTSAPGATTTTAPGPTTTAQGELPPPSTTAPAVCASNPALPASSPACTPGTSQTSAAACASNPSIMASSPACNSSASAATCPAGQQMDANGICLSTSVLAARAQAGTAAGAVGGVQAQTIPRTGTETRAPLILAGVLIMLGAPLALIFRRRPGKHFAG